MVQNLAEMPPSKWLFLWNECMMLGPHLYQLMATPHMQTEEMTSKDKAKKQAYTTTNWSSFCVEASAIMRVLELLPWKLAFWIQDC